MKDIGAPAAPDGRAMAEPCIYCGSRVRYESRRNEAAHALLKFNVSKPGWPLTLFCCTACETLHSEETLQAAFARVGAPL